MTAGARVVASAAGFDAGTEARRAGELDDTDMEHDTRRGRGAADPTSHASHHHAVGKQTLTGGVDPAPPRAALTDTERYAAILRLAGTTPDAWRGEIQTASFLGHGVTVHATMLAALQAAEATLRAEFPGREPAEIGRQLGIRAIESLRAVGHAAGRDVISAHAFGLAIDINKMIENRFIGMNATRPGPRGEASRTEVAAIDDAMWLIHGEHYNILHAEDGGTPAAELHAGYTRASEALVAYFALADDRERLIARMIAVGELTAGQVDAAAVERRQHRIAANRAAMRASNPDPTAPRGRRGHPAPAAPPDGRGDIATDGFYDLDLRLVEAMTRARLRWGGTLASGKDLMHFDWDHGPVTEARRRAGSHAG